MGKRILALTAAALLVITLCAGCGNGGIFGRNNTKSREGEPEAVDFGGHEFVVVDFNGGRWNRNNNGTPYDDAWQYLLDNVEEKFNCTIKFHNEKADEMKNSALPEIMAGDKYADILCATQWEFGKLIGADLMADLNILSTDWNNRWWNQNLREIATLQGKTFAANGSFIFDAAQTWLFYVNLDVWHDLQLPDPYELVENGEWTIDRLMEFSKKALLDMDGNGTVDTVDDRWGIAAPDGDFARALYMSGGNHYFIEKNGKLQMDCQGAGTFDFVEKMRKMNKDDKSVAKNSFFTGEGVDGVARRAQMFMDGRCLFLGGMPGMGALRDMDADWCVVPMPKASVEQESYMSGVDHNASVFGVTKTNADLDKVGILLDALGFYGLDLEDIYWPDYEETYWRHPQDAQIVADYVCHSGQYDMALLMQNVKDVFRSPMSLVFDTMFGGVNDFSSSVEMRKDQVNIALDKFFEDLTRDQAFSGNE
ncbi:MAG: extracellular solute-binding protein [Oscillospiraceae bacterium]|nr:extracellular solute-binding protein [Oscillospiraceae bacterium]